MCKFEFETYEKRMKRMKRMKREERNTHHIITLFNQKLNITIN